MKLDTLDNQSRTDFITSREDVFQNIERIYNYLENGAEDQKSWAQGIIRRGRVYVLEIINGQIFFAPSRFVGYKDNTYEKHTENHGNGNETNDQLEEFYYKSVMRKLILYFLIE